MRFIRHIGVGAGPVLEAGVLSEKYDFTKLNTLPMNDQDAALLVLRSGRSFADVTTQILTAREELKGIEPLIKAYEAKKKPIKAPVKKK